MVAATWLKKVGTTDAARMPWTRITPISWLTCSSAASFFVSFVASMPASPSKNAPVKTREKECGSELSAVALDFGIDLNAFYDRQGLKFFHGSAAGRTVFSGESPDVVCHELGHAVLDSLKPQLFDAASIEVAAFHESFGDMSALLSALQLPSVREGVLAETGGVLHRASRLSRLAEQLGWAIRQSVPSAVEADCLRNAVNTFFYRDPDTLPTTAPATSLSSEPHSFSRVFTGAFFEGLAGMLATTDSRDEAALLQV